MPTATAAEIKMKNPTPTKSMIPRQIILENIGFSGAKSATPTDDRTKVARWDLVTAGNCTMEGALLELVSNGWANFGCNLFSSGNDDSWGILSFHFHQDNGFVVWNSGSFWSPTIDNLQWNFTFQYPSYLFDLIASIDFTNHC
jgi:hypothetical protein